MKYKGIMELSVREYLGKEDGLTAWKPIRSVIGIKIGDDVFDYITLEKYKFIPRNPNSRFVRTPFEVVIGDTYAFEDTHNVFDINKQYSNHEIQKVIRKKEKKAKIKIKRI